LPARVEPGPGAARFLQGRERMPECVARGRPLRRAPRDGLDQILAIPEVPR
jgi:hypothetical protein